jgi:hypothetical protein
LRNIRLWHRIAKKHYIRLQYAATTRALRYFNAIKIQLYICIAIWSGNNVLCPNPRRFEPTDSRNLYIEPDPADHANPARAVAQHADATDQHFV